MQNDHDGKEPGEMSSNEALAAIAAARGSIAPRLDMPWTYDLAYGVSSGLIVASQGFEMPYGVALLVLGIAGLAHLTQWFRKRTGVWVNGFAANRARPVTIALMVALVALVIAVLYCRFALGMGWLAIPIGVVGGGIAIIASRAWTRAYRAELTEQP